MVDATDLNILNLSLFFAKKTVTAFKFKRKRSKTSILSQINFLNKLRGAETQRKLSFFCFSIVVQTERNRKKKKDKERVHNSIRISENPLILRS